MSHVASAATGPWAAIVRACQRLAPALDLDVDLLAVERMAESSTKADWSDATTATLTDTEVGPDGAVRLAEGAPSTAFTSTVGAASATVEHRFDDNAGQAAGYTLCFWPDPNVFGATSITLDSLAIVLGRQLQFPVSPSWVGVLEVTVGTYDDQWRFVPLGDPVRLSSSLFSLAMSAATCDFRDRGRRFTFAPGLMGTTTGPGYDGSALRTVDEDATGASRLRVPRAIVIRMVPVGSDSRCVIGLIPHATAARFVEGDFWRTAAATGRSSGPYPPGAPRSPLDTGYNMDGTLETGAVPGYGAKTVANGQWGVARPVLTTQAQQNIAATWEQPWHELKLVTYEPTGTVVKVLDLGATPTADVEVRIDDVQPVGTAITYLLERATSTAGPWTTVIAAGTATEDIDGQVLTGADLAQCYRLTATLAAGPAGATKYATPVLRAWAMVERSRLSTVRYVGPVDSSATVDPIEGKSEIGELQLRILKGGPRDYRDLGTSIASGYAPARLEAHVYARDTVGGTRVFLNAYRLENRNPEPGAESFTFVSGLDRLKVTVPPKSETYSYSGTVDSVALVAGTTYDVSVTGTPFSAGGLVGYRFFGLSGATAGKSYTITANTTSSVRIVVESASDAPAATDTFEIHSDTHDRPEVVYTEDDFADVYADVLTVQAEVPTRYRGAVPDATGLTTSKRLTGKGRPALEVLQELALIAGGCVTWTKGRIHYADIFGDKESVFVWDERHLAALDTPVGAERRIPSLAVKYNYDQASDAFANEATYDDLDALRGWGRANLFDITELPDELCQWLDQDGASTLAERLIAAGKTGVRIWRAVPVLPHPWLEIGDAGTIVGDQYTDRRLAFSADGVTDIGQPVAGRTATTAVIVGKNLWGTEFLLFVRTLDAVRVGVSGTGTVGGPLDGIAVPGDFDVAEVQQGTPTGYASALVATYTAPATPYFLRMEYTVRTSVDGGATWSAPSVVVGGKSGIDRIAATFNTRYEITPVTVSTGNVRTEGTAVEVLTGANPAAEITAVSTSRASAYVDFTLTCDDDFAYGECYAEERTADPGTAPDVHTPTTTPFALWDRADLDTNGQIVFRVPVSNASYYACLTALPFDHLSRRGDKVSAYAQGDAAASAPVAPASGAHLSTTGTTLTVRLTQPGALGLPVPDAARLYRGGILRRELAITPAGGSTHDLTETFLLPSTAYGGYEVCNVASGVESTRVAVPGTGTTAAVTLDAPTSFTITAGGGAWGTFSWDRGANDPGDAIFDIYKDGGPVFTDITGTTYIEALSPGTWTVRARRSPYTASGDSNAEVVT